MQDFAGAVEIHTDPGRDGLKPDRLGRIERLLEIAPRRGILATHPPQGVALRTIGLGDLDLVEHRSDVEKPHLVLTAIVVGVGIVGVQRIVVERDFGVRVVRRLGGVVKRDRRGLGRSLGVLQGPVIAVGAEYDDRVRRIQFLHIGRQGGLEPVLTRRGAGVAAGPVLVERHQHDRVDQTLNPLQIPGVVAERRSDPDLPTDRLEGGPGLGEKSRILRQRRFRQIFQVENIASVAPLLRQDDQVGDQGLARGRIGHQSAGHRPVDNVVVTGVNHGQDRRRRLGRGDQGLRLRIGGHVNVAKRAVE